MGRETNQAMLIHDNDRHSLLESCRLSAPSFLLPDKEARDLISAQITGTRVAWSGVCDEAEFGKVNHALFWRRQFLNDYAFEGYVDGAPKGL